MKTLVIGASENPERYSNMAIRKLISHGHEVVAIGQKNGAVAGVSIHTDRPEWDDIDTITLYINPGLQTQFTDYILSLKPRRIIFNPGTENPQLEEIVKANNIDPVEACTLVMLSIGNF